MKKSSIYFLGIVIILLLLILFYFSSGKTLDFQLYDAYFIYPLTFFWMVIAIHAGLVGLGYFILEKRQKKLGFWEVIHLLSFVIIIGYIFYWNHYQSHYLDLLTKADMTEEGLRNLTLDHHKALESFLWSMVFLVFLQLSLFTRLVFLLIFPKKEQLPPSSN